MHDLLRDLGIKIDYTVECDAGFQKDDWIRSAISAADWAIEKLEALIVKPRTHNRKNLERTEQIYKHNLKIAELLSIEQLQESEQEK